MILVYGTASGVEHRGRVPAGASEVPTALAANRRVDVAVVTCRLLRPASSRIAVFTGRPGKTLRTALRFANHGGCAGEAVAVAPDGRAVVTYRERQGLEVRRTDADRRPQRLGAMPFPTVPAIVADDDGRASVA